MIDTVWLEALMVLNSFRKMFFAGAICALLGSVRAQVVELRATINAAQENPATASEATGSAIMFYNVATSTFDLMISLRGMTNTASASHLHEGAAGANGGVVTNLGAEAVYTRSGSTLTATWRDIKHGGTALTLLKGGVYFNIHSAQFPGGEVRGQLIARPVRLYASMTVAQEQAAFPAVALVGLNDFGGAVMMYDPTTNQLSLRSSVFNFNNVLSNSHVHEGAAGVSGGVAHNLGNNANAGIYSNVSGAIQGAFDGPYLGDPVKLLSGGAYLNYHSTTFSGGELRGQIVGASEIPASRYINLSVRGFVGTGEQALISGLVINGTEPVRTLITAKGPSLAAFGISGPLANPRLDIYDSANRKIASNDDVGALIAGSELASLPGVPRNAVESALVLVLPPGNYTAIVSSAGGTGVAILEVNDLRTLSGTFTTVAVQQPTIPARASSLAVASKAALEFCTAPLATALVRP